MDSGRALTTAALARFTSCLRFADLPPEVVIRTPLLVLDCIGNAVRARRDSESTPSLLAGVRAMGLTDGKARVFADPECYSPAGAVLVNATLAHSLDFDDTHAAAIVHPGASIIPAALAAAEMTDASGAETLTAIVAGYEVALRLALALPAGAHYDRGFHPSATCGVFGAAASAARVFRLNESQTASAFGIALSQSAGSLQFLANGAWTKRFQVGWASMAGFAAATLAREGFKGAAEPIEGEYGFLRSYAPAPQPGRVLRDIGRIWELMQTGVKPYPSCRWGHAGVDAAIAMRSEYGLRAEDIEAVTLGISRAGMLLVGEPADKKINPTNIVEAQFSGPFVIASALAAGKMEWDSYKLLDDPATRALMRRVRCENDPDIEAEFPANMSGKLTVKSKGRTVTKTVIVPKGEPANFLSDMELGAKYSGLVEPVIGVGAGARLAKAVMGLEHLKHAASLLSEGI
ncbi:MAG: MmgE/PrpD family protein [Steroidobacteraceae bacterium]